MHMIIKARTKSVNLRVLESLNARKKLSFNEKLQFENQVKGFEGEIRFDDSMKNSHISGPVLNDLLLNTRDTQYQIDSLLITDDRIYLYEIKNYSGLYHYKEGSTYSESGHILQNPLAQAERKRAYLHNLLVKLGYKTELSAYVIYIDPAFYIYSLPHDPAIIFSGQLPTHFSDLKKQVYAVSESSIKLAEKLFSMHDSGFRPPNLPAYEFEQLRKGILCPDCFSFNYSASRQCRTCSDCGFREKTADAIHRSIEEFRLLFPDILITKSLIYTWCGSTYSKSRIQDVLRTKYHTKYAGRSTYYR